MPFASTSTVPDDKSFFTRSKFPTYTMHFAVALFPMRWGYLSGMEKLGFRILTKSLLLFANQDY